MKKMRLKLTTIVAMLLISFSSAFAQAPESMSYQAVIRNAAGALQTNKPVSMTVSILKADVAVYSETHTTTSNANGLVTIAIGNGTAPTGTFSTIDWSAGTYFVKTETSVDGGTAIVATSQLLSVPFAMYAKNSGSSTPGPKGDKGDTGATGPVGPAGEGLAGHDGASVNCLQCHDHNPATASTGMAAKLKNIQREIEHSKHAEGVELAIEEGYSTGCAPCHSNEGFTDVLANNTVPTYTLNATTGKYAFSYNATAANSSALTTMPSKVGCFTCHKGAAVDSMALTTVAAVPMAMYSMPGATKTIDLTQGGGISNLCVKCHQPRPMSLSSTLSTGAAVDYADLAANPTAIFYDSAVGNAAPNKLIPSYRTHNHYGTVGAVFAGVGAVEFDGTQTITSSAHATKATCQDCHMATPSGSNGGHSFKVATITPTSKSYNVKGCNIAGCHTGITINSTTKWITPRTTTASLLDTVAKLLKSGGIEILHKNTNPAENIFSRVTSAGYDGYLDIYDPSTNPDGALRNPAPSGSWTATQKSTNLALPKLTSLTNAQMGAIINFQLMLREYSLGIHNTAYTQTVLANTIEVLKAQGLTYAKK